MVKRFLALSCAMAFLSAPVAADDDGMKKYRNFLPEQILALPEKTRQSEVPIAYDFAANNARAEWAKQVVAGMLNALMYNGIGDYDGAIRAFQKDLGEEPTGKLTVWQTHQLGQRSEMQKATPPSIPGFFSDVKVAGYATVRGTLQMLDEKAAFPVNKVKIRCVEHEGFCTLDEIDVQFPSGTDWVMGFTVFWTDPLQYKITKWTNDVVEAAYEAHAQQCRNTKLQLNFKAKEYFMVTTNAGEECAEVWGLKFDKLARPRISRIVNGDKLIAEEYESFKRKQFELLASEHRAEIAEAIKRAQSAARPTTKSADN